MKTRRYCNQDYPKLCSWLDAIDWPHIPKESIPPYGILVYEGNQNLAIGFIYIAEESEYDFIYPGWIIFNPDIPYKKILKSMDFLAKAYESIAKENNKSHILLTLKTDSIINFLCRNHGYNKAEVGVTRLIKYIGDKKQETGIFWYDQEGIDKYFPESKYASKKIK